MPRRNERGHVERPLFRSAQSIFITNSNPILAGKCQKALLCAAGRTRLPSTGLPTTEGPFVHSKPLGGLLDGKAKFPTLGDLQGIAGKTLAEIDGLDLKLIDAPSVEVD